MSDEMLELLDSLADSPWAEQLTIGSDETSDGTPTAVASDVIRWAVSEIARLRLTDAEREAVGVAMQCVEAARCQRHPEEEGEADLLHSVYHTLRGLLDRMT